MVDHFQLQFVGLHLPEARSGAGEGEVVVLRMDSVEADFVDCAELNDEVDLKLLKSHWQALPQLTLRVRMPSKTEARGSSARHSHL